MIGNSVASEPSTVQDSSGDILLDDLVVQDDVSRSDIQESQNRKAAEGIEIFKRFVLLLIKQNDTDSNNITHKLLDTASALRGQNVIPTLVREALANLNEGLEKPISEPAFLDYIASCCVKQYQRADRIELVEIAIECYEHTLVLEPANTEDFETLAVLGNLYWNRFDKLRNPAYLDTAIEYLERAAKHTPQEHTIRLGILRDLGLSYRGRFEVYNKTNDIDLAIMYHAQAVEVVPDSSNPDTLTHIGHLGNSHLRRFEHLGDISDLNNAIACHNQASLLTPNDHPYKAGVLNNLGSSYFSRFKHLGVTEDLDLAIACHTQAVSLAPDEDRKKYIMLLSLGTSHRTRFERFGQYIDLDQEFRCIEHALSLLPNWHSGRPRVLMALGESHLSRFEHLQAPLDLEKATAYYNEALDSMSSQDPNYLRIRNKLAALYRSRFNNLGFVEDLDTALRLGEETIAVISGGSMNRLDTLRGLALSYSERYERLGDLKDLELAIEYTREGLSGLPSQSSSRIGWLSNLGSLYGSRLDRLGEIGDLDHATKCYDEAKSMMVEEHPNKPIIIHGLGNLHARRFKRLGELTDADKAIKYFVEAASSLPDSDSAKRVFLTNLGLAYRARFKYLELPTDNDMAIFYLNQALFLSADEQPEKQSGRWYYLGMLYSDRFEQSNNQADLDASIEHLGRGVSCIPDGHAGKPERLGSLGSAYMMRYRLSKLPADLELGIRLQEQALLLIPDNHTRKATLLNNLGRSYQVHFQHSDNLLDIERSIACLTESISYIPLADPRRAMFLGNLGHSHYARFVRLGEARDSMLAADCYVQGGRSPSGQPLIRFQMMQQWARIMLITDSPSVFDAYAELMKLVPRTVWLGSPIERRYEQITSIGEVGLEAASVAFPSGEYKLGIEWLEQGRSIVWNQLLGLRTPLENLMLINPPLGQEIQRTASQLQHTLAYDMIDTKGMPANEGPEANAQKRHSLALKWEQLIDQAQLLPELQDFLRPKRAEELIAVCENTTVAIVIIHE